MFQLTANKRIKMKPIHGPGFSLKVPRDFPNHSEEDPHAQWGYEEFFQINTFNGKIEPQTNLLFYYWQKAELKPSAEQAAGLIEKICKERVFNGQHSLELDENFPLTFKQYPAFFSKYRFSHREPEVEGKVDFFSIYNPRIGKVIVVGTLVQAIGNHILENESMAWLEDQVISTFRFKKKTSVKKD